VLAEFRVNTGSMGEIARHLLQCDADFVPPLSERVDICAYAEKITRYATRFEAWAGPDLAGLLAAYYNDRARGTAFITSISVLRSLHGKGIGSQLMNRCTSYASDQGFTRIELQVFKASDRALIFYEKLGFIVSAVHEGTVTMSLKP
jgi:ribosomal protein S18 acetylase RimI-like enzyme